MDEPLSLLPHSSREKPSNQEPTLESLISAEEESNLRLCHFGGVLLDRPVPG